jgi:hypothetical protein
MAAAVETRQHEAAIIIKVNSNLPMKGLSAGAKFS